MFEKNNNFTICQSAVGFFVELVENNGFAVKSIECSGKNEYKILLNIPNETEDFLYSRIQNNLDKKINNPADSTHEQLQPPAAY